MIITLKGADFSADNIGQVELERTLNAYTLAAITASGNENLTDTQKFALDDLFLAMGVDGSNNVMSKMRKMYLPMIANDVANALINYADNTFPADVTPNSANWELRNLGIAQKASGQNLSLTLSSPLVASNFTQMWLRTENMVSGVSDTCYSLTLRGKTNNSLWLGLQESSVSSNGMISFSDYGYNNVPEFVKSFEQRSVFGISYRGADDISLQRYGSYGSEDGITPKVDMSGESSQTLYILGTNNQVAPHPYGFMLLGEAITDAQFKDIRDKVNALYAAMKGE